MIRPAEKEDIPQITAICNHYIVNSTAVFDMQPMDEDDMMRRYDDITGGGLPFFVAETEKGIVGYCYVHPWKEKQAYMSTLEVTIYLSPDEVGHGVGTQLLERLLDECRHRNVHALIACITSGNEASEHIFKKYGFKQVSLFAEVGRKFGKWLDVIDYELVLS